MRTFVAIVVTLFAVRSDAAPLKCADVEADHKAAEDKTKAAFEAALAAKHLTLVTLELSDPGEFPSEQEATRAVAKGTPAWKQFTYKAKGKLGEAIASDAYRSDGWKGEPPELVKDDHGDIWRVQRKPTTQVVKTVSVKACSWGCWGFAGHGINRPMSFTRDVWLLPAKSTFRGNLEVAYTAPTLVVNYVTEQCAPPP
jgi:hypothetical protein